MSDNCILKFPVEIEVEKYLAIVIPQLQFNCFLWFVCATSLLIRNVFPVFALEGTYHHFLNYRKIPRLSKSHRTTGELPIVICKTLVHLPQQRTNVGSLILIFAIVPACQAMVLYEIWFDFSEEHRATRSSVPHTAVGCQHRWQQASSSLFHHGSSGLLVHMTHTCSAFRDGVILPRDECVS